MTKPGIRVGLWACTAVAVTVAASLAIAASVGARGTALSPDDVERALAADPGSSISTAGSTATPRTTSTGPSVVSGTRTPGGTATTGATDGTIGAAGGPAGASGGAPGGSAGGVTPIDHVNTGISGSVVVRCTGDQAELISWSPNPGYWADDPVRGPAAAVGVKFESDVAADMVFTASCSGGLVTVSELAAAGGGGGNRGPGGGSH